MAVRQSPLYQVIERHLPEFERTYNDRYQRRYGAWRPIIGEVARKFLRCGDLHFDFARVRCGDCSHVRPIKQRILLDFDYSARFLAAR